MKCLADEVVFNSPPTKLLLVFIDAGGDQGEANIIAPRALAFLAFAFSSPHDDEFGAIPTRRAFII